MSDPRIDRSDPVQRDAEDSYVLATAKDKGLYAEATAERRLEVARRWASFHLGDSSWADEILQVFADPDKAAEELDIEDAP